MPALTVRVESDIPGYEDCFVEVSGAWTVRELNSLLDGQEQWRALWQRKVVSCHLRTAAGEELTSAEAVMAQFDDLDVALARFVNTSLSAAVDYAATLGGRQRRVSSGGGGAPTTTTPSMS